MLDKVWKETKTPFLMFATEKAIYEERIPLTGPLERFVKADNKAFRQELHQETSTPTWGETSTPGITSPSKRKHRSDSVDSMASNRASIASSDAGKFDDAFIDASGGQEQSQQDWIDPFQTQEHSVTGDGEKVPPLPARPPVSTGDTSTTMTPNTIGAGDGESPLPGVTQQATPSGNGTTTIESELTTITVKGTKGPEMQERSQMPSLFLSRQNSEKGNKSGSGEMDIDS